jgi:hypothetical protein
MWKYCLNTYLSFSIALQPLWTLAAFSVSWSIQVGRTPWTGDQLVARLLPTHRTTQAEKSTQISMPRVGFDTIPAFGRAKPVHALERSVTVICLILTYSCTNKATKFLISGSSEISMEIQDILYIYLKELRKPTENLRTTGVRTKIQTGCFLNTNNKCLVNWVKRERFDLYPRRARLESWPGHWLSRLRSFVEFLLYANDGIIPRLDRNRFLPHPFQFIFY